MVTEDDRPPASARRHATVLFADVSGFTAMSRTMDPEDVRDVMNRCFAMLEEVVVRHGGWVDKYIGDCVMALFGAPRAIEDAPRQAINAAIEMRNRLAALSRERALPAPLDLHVGINTGLVLAGDVGGATRRDFTVMGDAVNLAARLKDEAVSRQILVGPQTWAEARDVFKFGEVPRLELKGVEGPFAAHEVLSEREQLHRGRGDDAERTLFSAMVGRDTELTLLRSRLHDLPSGRGAIVSVVAEAGLGKSRLLAETLRLPEAGGATVLRARAVSIGESLPFHPFVDLLRGWAGIAEEDGEGAAREKLARALHGVLGERTEEILPSWPR
jgi:class 3 adenylate cyclase